ncbi:MAG: sensor protein, partial [Deinococcota bacterium]
MLTQSKTSILHQNDSNLLHSALNLIPKGTDHTISNTVSSSSFEFFLNALHTNAAIMDMSGTIIAVNPAWKRFNKLGQDAICIVGQNYFRYRLKTSGQHPILSEQFAQGLERILQGQAESFLLESPYGNSKKPSQIAIQAKQMSYQDQRYILVQFEDKPLLAVVQHQADKHQRDLE